MTYIYIYLKYFGIFNVFVFFEVFIIILCSVFFLISGNVRPKTASTYHEIHNNTKHTRLYKTIQNNK